MSATVVEYGQPANNSFWSEWGDSIKMIGSDISSGISKILNQFGVTKLGELLVDLGKSIRNSIINDNATKNTINGLTEPEKVSLNQIGSVKANEYQNGVIAKTRDAPSLSPVNPINFVEQAKELAQKATQNTLERSHSNEMIGYAKDLAHQVMDTVAAHTKTNDIVAYTKELAQRTTMDVSGKTGSSLMQTNYQQADNDAWNPNLLKSVIDRVNRGEDVRPEEFDPPVFNGLKFK